MTEERSYCSQGQKIPLCGSRNLNVEKKPGSHLKISKFQAEGTVLVNSWGMTL